MKRGYPDEDAAGSQGRAAEPRGLAFPGGAWQRGFRYLAAGGVLLTLVLAASAQVVVVPSTSPTSTRPELVLQSGHAMQITSVCFSPDGQQILTGSYDQTAKLWDVRTGQNLRTFHGHAEKVSSVAFSPDGRHILTSSWDMTARLYDAETGQMLRLYKRGAFGAAFHPDGRHLVFGGAGDGAELRDRHTDRVVQTYKGHDKTIWSLAFSPDGQRLVTGSSDQSVRLWNTQTGQPLHVLKGHTGPVHSVAFSPDGRHLLSGSADKTARLWDAQTGRLRHTLAGHSEGVNAVAFSPDGQLALTGATDKTARLWDARTGGVVRVLQGHGGFVEAVAFSPDGQQLLTGAGDQITRLWEVQTGQLSRTFQGQTEMVWSVAISADGRLILTCSRNRTPVLWDASAGQPLRTLEGHTDIVYAAAFSADGRKAVTVSKDLTARLWDVHTGQTLRTFRGHTQLSSALSLSPDGRQLLTGSEDKTARLWDVETGTLVRTLEGHTHTVHRVAFSPDGHHVLTASLDKTTRLWDTRTGKTIGTRDGLVFSIAFHPDGRRVFSGYYNDKMELWDLQTGQSVRTLKEKATFTTPWVLDSDIARAAVFGADGRQLLTGSSNRTAQLWDVPTGRLLRTFRGHASEIGAVAFRPGNRHVLTAAHDGTTRLWDTATGDELARLISVDSGRDWAVVTPAGLFDGSRRGREHVYFRVGKGLDVVPLDRFFQDFYYPGLLAELWRGERPTPEKEMQTQPAPLVRLLLSPEAKPTAAPDRVVINVAVTDRGGGVRGPWLQHNGARVAAGSTVRREGKTAQHRFTVPLVRGDNRIEVRAATADGARESEPAFLSVPFSGTLPEPDLYVLAIGINRHASGSGISNLDFCVPDARALTDLFQKRSGPLYHQVHVTRLFDEQATHSRIMAALADIAQKAQPQDTLVMYVAGHGLAVGQRFYLLPHDFTLPAEILVEQARPTPAAGASVRSAQAAARTEAVRRQGLAIDELGDTLALVPALRRVLIFDTCHSGSVSALAGKQVNPLAFRGSIQRLSGAQGVYTLAATAADELAAENRELGHSILTYALLAALEAVEHGPLAGQAAAPRGGGHEVDVLAWFRYARRHVPALYQKYVGRPQHVEMSGEDQPSFPLLLRKGPS